MRFLQNNPEDIRLAGSALRNGKLVAIPTETVYGLAGNIWEPSAVAGIFKAKERPNFDPLIVHIADPGDVSLVADTSSPLLPLLVEAFWPGPLTLILPRKTCVSDLITSGLDTVAVRCPALALTREIIAASRVPVAAPSANLFGRLSPTTAEHVAEQLGARIDYIVDGGQTSIGVESTILDISGDQPLILRPGALPAEKIAVVLPGIQVKERQTFDNPNAPGQLLNHYAPRKPLLLADTGKLTDQYFLDNLAGKAISMLQEANTPASYSYRQECVAPESLFRHRAALTFGREQTALVLASGLFEKVFDLSPELSDIEAAVQLFVLLHKLEATACDSIWVEPLPARGLGLAINDRLRKASLKLNL